MSLGPAARASLGSVLVRAVVAGLAAALVVALFHFAVTEPIIEQAISLEEARDEAEHGGAADAAAPIVSREAQRIGLFVGFLIFGLTWSVLLGGVSYLAQAWAPPGGLAQRVMLLTLGAYWSISLLPSIKYPANPPGVGDPETIGVRQGLYLACLALGLLGVALGLMAGSRVGSQRGRFMGWVTGVSTVGVFSALVLFGLPPSPDAATMPPALIDSFRVLSVAGLTLFWAILGVLFAGLLGRLAPGRVHRPVA